MSLDFVCSCLFVCVCVRLIEKQRKRERKIYRQIDEEEVAYEKMEKDTKSEENKNEKK